MIRTEHLNINLHPFFLRDVTLSIEKNDFFVLMGPTGAGKTVLLEALAGLIPVQSGRIWIGGKEVTRLPPEKRGVSIVYQDYALFPHLTVRENILYGLRFHKRDREEAPQRLCEFLETLNLSHLQDRFPTYLSGGEKQRVALARALIVKPKLVLLDEPLSAQDPGFRQEIRGIIRRLHQSSGVTFLMVTHHFAEAISLAIRGAVMNNGKIEQIGTIENIFQRPISTFVADFVGMKNLFPARFKGTKAFVGHLEVESGRTLPNREGYIAIRPEDIAISSEKITSNSNMSNQFVGRVTEIFDRGFYYEVHLVADHLTFKSLVSKRSFFEVGIREGIELFLSFKPTGIHTL
jgi:molybdate/tungstate transport system ATP-binding protein